MGAQSEFLRRAATTLLTAADKATRGPWTADRKPVDELHFGWVDMTVLDAPSRNLFAVASLPLSDAEYMVMVHPPVAAALVVWLDAAAGSAESAESLARLRTVVGDWRTFVRYSELVTFALPVAAAILREEPPS